MKNILLVAFGLLCLATPVGAQESDPYKALISYCKAWAEDNGHNISPEFLYPPDSKIPQYSGDCPTYILDHTTTFTEEEKYTAQHAFEFRAEHRIQKAEEYRALPYPYYDWTNRDGATAQSEFFSAEVYSYCKAWAADTTKHSVFSMQFGVVEFKEDCPTYIQRQASWFTPVSQQIAADVLKEREAKQKAEIQQAETEAKKRNEESNNRELAREAESVSHAIQRFTALGLRFGESQAFVKAALAKAGYSPWTCTASNGTYKGYQARFSNCVAQKQNGELIEVDFLVSQPVLNSDTQERSYAKFDSLMMVSTNLDYSGVVGGVAVIHCAPSNGSQTHITLATCQ